MSRDDGSERVSAIARKQRELGDRLDRVLSSAMASHKGPDVSESERKWFDELEKLHAQLGGLSTRFSQVRRPFARVVKNVGLMPSDEPGSQESQV